MAQNFHSAREQSLVLNFSMIIGFPSLQAVRTTLSNTCAKTSMKKACCYVTYS
ncbi:hypothetical protein CCACVL1_28019 [Corchorus capsularis]|uniref:Uncharacterized protein n=1 Tax=Corchorus capsularis TaxID=210143 RepID=A0A1R3G7T3_COCAP|nr:hypothetical protein CCACVL1_28019 [Corchorus capsularis]